MAVSDFGHRARPSRRRGTMAAAAADHTALNKPFSGRTARRQGFREPHRDTRTVADDDRPEQTIFAAVDVLAERAREVMLITRFRREHSRRPRRSRAALRDPHKAFRKEADCARIWKPEPRFSEAEKSARCLEQTGDKGQVFSIDLRFSIDCSLIAAASETYPQINMRTNSDNCLLTRKHSYTYCLRCKIFFFLWPNLTISSRQKRWVVLLFYGAP